MCCCCWFSLHYLVLLITRLEEWRGNGMMVATVAQNTCYVEWGKDKVRFFVMKRQLLDIKCDTAGLIKCRLYQLYDFSFIHCISVVLDCNMQQGVLVPPPVCWACHLPAVCYHIQFFFFIPTSLFLASAEHFILLTRLEICFCYFPHIQTKFYSLSATFFFLFFYQNAQFWRLMIDVTFLCFCVLVPEH